MKFQQPIVLENGGALWLPPNPDMINTSIPNLRQADVVQLYPLTTRYRYNGKTFVYARGRRQGDAGEYVNAQLLACKGCVAGNYVMINESTTNIHSHDEGDEEVVVELASVAVDDFKYGHIAIGAEDNTLAMSCGILGNTASETDSPYEVTLTLDAPLGHDTTHDTTEIVLWKSPYEAVEWGGPDYTFASIIGVPQVNITQGNLDGQWFWIQTWGPCFIKAGDAGTGATAQQRHLETDGQGQNRIPADDGKRQNLGFLLARTKDAYTSLTAHKSDFIMLQIDP